MSHGGKRPGAGRKKGAPNTGRGKNSKKWLVKTKTYRQYILEYLKKTRKAHKKADPIYRLFLKTKKML